MQPWFKKWEKNRFQVYVALVKGENLLKEKSMMIGRMIWEALLLWAAPSHVAIQIRGTSAAQAAQEHRAALR